MSWDFLDDLDELECKLEYEKCTVEESLKLFCDNLEDFRVFISSRTFAKADIVNEMHDHDDEDVVNKYGQEIESKIWAISRHIGQLLKGSDPNVNLKRLRDYAISLFQNEPLSLIVLLAIARSTVSMIESCGGKSSLMILTEEEIKNILERYINDFLSEGSSKKLKAVENAILITLIAANIDIIELFQLNKNDIISSFLRLLSSEDMQSKLIGWVALGEILIGFFTPRLEPSLADMLKSEAKKLLPHLFTLVQNTGNENLVSILEMLMDRNEGNVHMFMNALLQLDEIPKEYLEFISSLLCTDEYDVRLEVYTGIQELYNKRLLDNKNLDFIYNKLLEKCSKGVARQ